MADDWTPIDTSTHQDHVIAHTLGATILGYFVLELSIAILLDIGFIWMIYLDGEMGLLPQSVMISELEIEEEMRRALREDLDLLQRDGIGVEGLAHFTAAPVECLITGVSFAARGEDERLLMIACEESTFAVETSLLTGRISVHVAATTAARDSA